MVNSSYTVNVSPVPDEDGGGWMATVSELPGCMADGETAEEAKVNAEAAIMAWISEARRLKRQVPAPGQHAHS